MKATVFLVSDDTEVVQKVKSQFDTEAQVAFRVFTTSQWDQILEDQMARRTVHVGVPTLSSGLSADNSAKVFPLFGNRSQSGGGFETMEQLEAKAIEAAIIKFKGNLTEAAKALGIGRATLYRKVKHFSIDPNVARKRRAA